MASHGIDKQRPDPFSPSWRLAAKKVNDDMFKLVADGQLPLSDLPNFTKWKREFRGIFGSNPPTVDDLNVHHAVESWIQKEKLGLVENSNDVPGYILSGPAHTSGYGTPFSQTLAGKLRAAIDPLSAGDKLLVTTRMRDVYLGEGLGDLWKVAKMWLDQKGIPTPP